MRAKSSLVISTDGAHPFNTQIDANRRLHALTPVAGVLSVMGFCDSVESHAGEHISKLFNFEQTLDCQCRHDIREQTSGEGCSANVPTRKSLGRFVWGEGLQSGLTNLLWHHPDAPHFQEMCNVEQTPNAAWCKLT
jgi:hypothetical protein